MEILILDIKLVFMTASRICFRLSANHTYLLMTKLLLRTRRHLLWETSWHDFLSIFLWSCRGSPKWPARPRPALPYHNVFFVVETGSPYSFLCREAMAELLSNTIDGHCMSGIIRVVLCPGGVFESHHSDSRGISCRGRFLFLIVELCTSCFRSNDIHVS